jgi:hypothetical protein
MIYAEKITNDLWLEDYKGERNKVLTYLEMSNFEKVIDVGGAMGSWVDEYVTAYFDCNTDILVGNEKRMFKGNLSEPEDWEEVFQYVKENGKFDFANCTQTLEDIRNPSFVLKNLPKIAKEGYIDIPSKYLELKFGNENPDSKDRIIWGLDGLIMGYTGHRWIFNMNDKVLEMYPKLPFIEHLTGLDDLIFHKDPKYMLCFWWKEDIPFKIVNDDFIGPNPPSVYNMYREGLKKGLNS